MQLRDLLIISRGTKVILAITVSVSLLAMAFAFLYYNSINRSQDPRITKAREYLSLYEKSSGGINSFEAFYLLDSAYSIFHTLPDYRSSYEIGLIYNNKCSGLLLLAVYDSTITDSDKSRLLDLSMSYCDSSIFIYKAWIKEWGALISSSIYKKISQFMSVDDPAFRDFNYEKIASRRVKNIILAQVETPRRLSVSLSNKGTIFRHLLKPDSSLMCYKEALALWNDNRTAKSNLNVLLGGEPVKPTLIQSLFPPDKNKK